MNNEEPILQTVSWCYTKENAQEILAQIHAGMRFQCKLWLKRRYQIQQCVCVCVQLNHLITAMQGAAGVVEVKWKVKPCDTVGLLQVCLLSDAAVKVRCDMQAEPSGAVQSVYRQKLWPISWSWILSRLVDVKHSSTLQATNSSHSSTGRAG